MLQIQNKKCKIEQFRHVSRIYERIRSLNNADVSGNMFFPNREIEIRLILLIEVYFVKLFEHKLSAKIKS
jgi:hypothetical protein